MKTETSRGSAESAYGRPLADAIVFDYSHTVYESLEEVRTAGEFPSDKEILGFVNNKVKQNERNKAQNAAFTAAGIEKPTNKDRDFAIKNMVAILTAQGKSEDEARQLAESLIPAA